MISVSQFVAAFREPDESLCLRAFKPKRVPDFGERREEMDHNSI